jgi:hypothetical protein
VEVEKDRTIESRIENREKEGKRRRR